jgi:DNA-binding winged helix-turn-helix (wHTH) protein
LSATPSLRLRFANLEVNTGLGEVRRNGRKIKLQDKPFQILVALLERPGELVSREELRSRLWSDNTFVDFDHNLNNAVEKLRKVLNDSAEEPKFIATVPRRGYRFIAQLEPFSAPVISKIEEAVAPVAVEEASAKDLGNITAPQAAQITSESAVFRLMDSRRGRMTGTAVVGLLVLVLLFASLRFFDPKRLHASSRYSSVPEITSVVIEKSAGLEPLDEGFKLQAFGQYDSNPMHNVLNNGFDRWKIVSDDQLYYYRPLTTAEKAFATTHDWSLVCVCAVQAGGAFSDIDLGKGARRFDIQLLREGDKYFVGLTQQLSPNFELAEKVEFSGVADINHPHTFELRYRHATQTAALWIDGSMVSSGYRGYTQYVQDHGLMFGSANYLSSKTGVGIFRSIRFEAH